MNNHLNDDKAYMLKKESLKLLPFYLFFIIITIAVSKNSFFWDKDIIISKQAYWFYENGFSLHIPNSIDTGYTPLLGIVLAVLWKIFGIKLQVGHYLMLPFSLGLIYQLFIFLKHLFSKNRYIYLTLIMVVIDTTLLSQVIVVSSDLIMAFFFFLSINSIIKRKRYILYFSLAGLSLIHFRGVISCFIVFVFDYFYSIPLYRKRNLKNFIYTIPQYLPAIVIYIVYLAYHFKTTGWILKHDESPWAGSFEIVNFKGFIRNIIIVIWRLIDFGRLFQWIIGFYFIYLLVKKKITPDSKLGLLAALISFSLILNLPSMLLFNLLTGHRYFIIIYILITITVSYLIFEKTSSVKLSNIFFAVIVTGLLTGNLWIYPDKIAKGWDATIAHIPYYHLRKKMIEYIDNKRIPFSEVGSGIPNTSGLKYTDLSDDERVFPLKDFKKNKYIFYSNIYNMFSDKEIDELKQTWILEKECRCMQVYVRLYRNPRYSGPQGSEQDHHEPEYGEPNHGEPDQYEPDYHEPEHVKNSS